ncbi:MAG: RES family NAD+ phosphorylase [Nitrospinae bacterium]|nr:RES family NAD+ phosphorylase [Nitrospinota bacterium]
MTIRKPQAKLADPNVVTLGAGAFVHRVHDRNYGGSAFNPCKGSPTRFAPVYDATDKCVPSLYAAGTLEAAIHETIFHDVPVTAKRKTVPRTLVQSRAHVQLEVLRDLRLASLRGPDLRRWRIARSSLIGASPELYPETARWASAIHHQFPEVHGLLWTSNQCDPDTAYLFFGDRVKPEDFRILNARDGMFDTTFLSDVRLAGLRCGITITV